jgi:hypothetical protein
MTPAYDNLVAMYESGMSFSQIGDAAGLTVGAVAGRIRRTLAAREAAAKAGYIAPEPVSPRLQHLAPYDPNRADKVLRRFSWQEPAE